MTAVGLAIWIARNATELDGKLARRNRRLLAGPNAPKLIELLNLAYSFMVENQDTEGRRKIDLGLAGKLGPHGGEIIHDPLLPESMQGHEAPSWWRADDDPFAETIQIDSTYWGNG